MRLTDPAWVQDAHARLTARLSQDAACPVALALSGGGDSLALLRIAAAWARANHRPLLALTVDHGLNPASEGWTAFARDAALAAGAEWRGLAWTGHKPSTGLPAAARRARHALIAEAARQAGARVVLFGHTADDRLEAERMRAQGSTVGDPREWTPSPAWPEGRGLMLLRPLLAARRAEIRKWLAAQGATWIDDPANDDERFARSRARHFLLPLGGGGSHRDPTTGGRAEPGRIRVDCISRREPPLRSATRLTPTAESRLSPFDAPRRPSGRLADRSALGGSSPLPSGEGALCVDRNIPAQALAAALVCVGGGDQTPRRPRLARLIARLRSGEDFTAVLAGARLEANGARILITREPGELTRRAARPLPLPPNVETIWDGRWAIISSEPGWSAVAAAGLRARLSKADQAQLAALPPAVRGGLPVLIRDDGRGPVLATTAARAWSLVEQRLTLALDQTTHERHLEPGTHGARPCGHLFSGAECERQTGASRPPEPRRE